MKLRDLFELIKQEFRLITKEAAAITHPDEYEQSDLRCEFKRAKFKSVQAFLTSIGGALVGSGCSSYAYRFDLPWGSVVVKISRTECNYVRRRDLDANPVLREHYLHHLFADTHCMIQPLCDPIREAGMGYDEQRRIVDDLERRLKNGSPNRWHYDCHSGNVGHWRGKLVIFDAMPETF